ncbi:MAG: hypothetical protein WC341_13555, partial [Bacteroidales bacterium]|jgi:hypothetical protein
VGETERFVQCEFDLTGVRVVKVGGVDFQHIRSASDLNLGDMMTLTQRLFNGNMPATLEVDVNARNHNQKIARISGLAWKVYLKELEFVGGRMDRGVEVNPNSAVNFPIQVQVDLVEMLHQESLPEMLNVVFGMHDNSKLKELGLSVKIKPAYRTATGNTNELPFWITINP